MTTVRQVANWNGILSSGRDMIFEGGVRAACSEENTEQSS